MLTVTVKASYVNSKGHKATWHVVVQENNWNDVWDAFWEKAWRPRRKYTTLQVVKVTEDLNAWRSVLGIVYNGGATC